MRAYGASLALEPGHDPTAGRCVIDEGNGGIQRARTWVAAAGNDVIYVNGGRMGSLIRQVELVGTSWIFLLNVDQPGLSLGAVLQ